jgi:RHS repeat-associated protein
MIVATVLLVSAGAVQAAKTVTYYYTDPLGTVLQTTDALGNATGDDDATPFGSLFGEFTVGNVRYATHVVDDDPGFIYMAARYYDPSVGRFISADPIFPGLADVFSSIGLLTRTTILFET